MSSLRTCVVCGKEYDTEKTLKKWNNVCSPVCLGNTGGAKKKPLQPKVVKYNRRGYQYYTPTMLTEEEREFFPGQHCILVHRYVMTMHLGRVLRRNEMVMHINGDKSDNRLENLAIGAGFENTLQHTTARIEAERSKYLAAWVLIVLSKFG